MTFDLVLISFFIFGVFTIYIIFDIIEKLNLEDNLLFHFFIFILFIVDFIYLNCFNKTLYFMFILHILIDFIDTAKTRNIHLMEIYYWNKNHLNLYIIFLHVIRIILIISLILLLLLQLYNIIFL